MTVTVQAQRRLLAFDQSSCHVVVGWAAAGSELVRRSCDGYGVRGRDYGPRIHTSVGIRDVLR
jgi:hypothetical protein